MLLLHPLRMEEWIVSTTASPPTRSIRLVKLIGFLFDMLHIGATTPWTFSSSPGQLVLLCLAVAWLHMVAWRTSSVSLCLFKGAAYYIPCDVVRISHHVCFVVRVESCWDLTEDVIFRFDFFIIPVAEVLFLVAKVLSLDHSCSHFWRDMRTKLILNFNWDFLYFVWVFCEDFKSMNSLMCQLILFQSLILLILDLDHLFNRHFTSRYISSQPRTLTGWFP